MKTSRFLIAGAVAALLQTGVAAAQSPPPEQAGAPTQPTHPTQPKSDASFASLDKDGDGRISKREAEADAKVKQQFIDKDEVMNPESSQPEPPKQ